MNNSVPDQGAARHDSHLLPRDADWRESKELLADLSELNTDIARYVLLQLDVDAGRAKPVDMDDEQAFDRRLTEVGERLQRRVARRRIRANEPGLAIGGDTAQPRELESGRERMDTGP